MINYSWRIDVGNKITVARGLDEVILPLPYHLEEARLLDGSMRVYLMRGEQEVRSWEITDHSPLGEDILECCK